MKYEEVIRQRFDVVSVSGDEFLCRCPFHNDTGKPNLYVNGVKGLYYCHACQAKGSLKDVPVEEDWRKLLARIEGSDRPRQKYMRNEYLKQFRHPHPYWSEQRGFSEKTIKRFELGYDIMRNEGVIPVRDHRSRLIGVIRRRFDADVDGGPRYLYPKGFPLSKTLFGMWLLGVRHRKVALVEGSLDAIACWNARVPALALLGSRLSEAQHDLLHKLGIEHVVVFTDNDRAGRAAVEQIHEEVHGLQVSAVQYRPYWSGKDPGDLTEKQIRKAYHSARLLTMRIDE